MYDAIVVGARCAGSPTAMLLARKGHRVLLVDRASFPSDTLSTHYIHQSGVASPGALGAAATRIVAAGAPADPRLHARRRAVRAARRAAADRRRRGRLLACAAPCSTSILVEAAAAAGAEVRERFPVDELVLEDGRVDRHPLAAAGVTSRARIVIGADGLRLARRARASARRCTTTTADAHLRVLHVLERRPDRRRRALPARPAG